MDNRQSILNILDFYIKASKLKTTLYSKKSDESYSDHIFGSLLLATLINSEFRETDNLEKIYRMILLKGMGSLNKDYNYDNLNDRIKFQDEECEMDEDLTHYANLANRYTRINFLISNFINQNKDMSYEDLVKGGSNILSLLLRQDDDKCKEIFKCYYLNERLKHSIRTGWDRNHWNISAPRVERISEHVASTMYLVLALKSEFPHDIDYQKVLKMLSIHELGETIIGDITPFDNITKEEKKEMEHIAIYDALGNLTSKEELYNLLLEFDEGTTKEAKFAHYCDKIDADLQSKLYEDQGYHHQLAEQKNNLVFLNPKVQKFVLDGAVTPFDIWFLWDKSIYENDYDFPEFIRLLRTVKENNLVKNSEKQKIKMNEDY